MPATLRTTVMSREPDLTRIPVMLEGLVLDEPTTHRRNALVPLRRRQSRAMGLSSSSSDESLSHTLQRLSPTSAGRNIDKKAGSLYLVEFDDEGLESAFRVFVTVIGNHYEQHAQIYTDERFNEQLGYISLRNCHIYVDGDDARVIYITLNNFKETPKTLKLISASAEDAMEWVKALRPTIDLPRSSDCSPSGSPMLSRCFFTTKLPTVDSIVV